MIAELGHAFAVSGDRDQAGKVLDELKELSRQQYVSPYYMALIYTGLGEKDQAFDWLEKAYKERGTWLIYLGVHPIFDDLRPDPRYAELVRRIGLKA